MHRPIVVRLAVLLLLAWITAPTADVLVFGGTRGAGLETVRLLRERGEAVTVMVGKTSELARLIVASIDDE